MEPEKGNSRNSAKILITLQANLLTMALLFESLL